MDKEQSLFEQFPSAFPESSSRSDGVDNPRDREMLTILRNEREKGLSPYAFHTKDSRGRQIEEEPCLVRSPFERDT